MIMLGCAALILAGAAALVMTALQDNIVFFRSPSDVVEKKLSWSAVITSAAARLAQLGA